MMTTMKGKKVCVTGGCGFIGSHIAEHLSHDNDVIVLDDLSSGKRENIDGMKVELVIGSVRDADLVRDTFQGVDYIFHHAALASVPGSIDDPVLSNQVNVCGTLRVLMEAREARVKKVVFASSSSVYGDTSILPTAETLPTRPMSPYAITKMTGESYCRVFWEVYGLRTSSLRYFNVFGPRQDPASQYAAVIPRFIAAAMSGKRLTVYGDGEQTRDFTYVEDVVQANVLAALSERSDGECFNVARNESISVNRLAEMVLQYFGKGPDGNVEHLPERKGEIKHSQASVDKARSYFGYHPEFTVEEGLARTIEHFR